MGTFTRTRCGGWVVFYATCVDGTGSDFFVSYNSADERWAEWISHVLEDAGYSVVVQAWDFRPGSNFVLEMQKALRTSERLIAVLSPDYLAARYPQPEWAAVFSADPEGASRKLIPVMVRPCQLTGLLAQIVHIRIHDLDDAPAKQRLLDGVRPGRGKPATPPAFPGAAGSGSGRAAGASAATGRLRWQRLPSTPTVIWRCELEERMPNQSGSEAVELHLVPVGDDARLQVRQLTELKRTLAEHGRRHGIFSPTEALDTRNDGGKAVVFSLERGKVAGIAVTREGQRSAWVGLPRDMLGAVLDEVHLTDRLIEILGALTSRGRGVLIGGDLTYRRVGRPVATPSVPDCPAMVQRRLRAAGGCSALMGSLFPGRSGLLA